MKALIILNGEYSGKEMLQALAAEADMVICADGGANHARAAGIPIDIIMGDMDSFHGDSQIEAEFINYPREKDYTDGELALDIAIEKGADNIVIACAGGGRADHFYGNLLLLKRAAEKSIDCRIIAGDYEIMLATGAYTSKTTPGKTVSVLPFEGDFTYIKNSGLIYKIDSPVHVHAHECFGISNESASDFVEIYINGGKALIFKQL